MQDRARLGRALRIVAALLALAISGAPRVVALAAPPESHSCSCAAHAPGQECPCAMCRRASAPKRGVEPVRASCHPRLPQAASPARGGRAPAGAPTLEGTCGDNPIAAVTPAGLEPFVVMAAAAAAPPWRADAVRIRVARCPARAIEPETPQPRAALAAPVVRADVRSTE